MDSSDDDMLFGDTAGAYNNSNQQSPPEVHTSSSPIRTSRAAIPSDTTVDVDTDEREVLIPLPSPATQDVSPIELPPGGIVLPPGKRDRYCLISVQLISYTSSFILFLAHLTMPIVADFVIYRILTFSE